MKKSYTLLIGLITLLLFACSEEENKSAIPSKGETIPVKVQNLTKDVFTSPIAASGSFTTNNETILSFKIGGIITQLKVKEGDRVQKGEVLASLDLTEIQTSLNQAKLALEKSERDYSRAERLYKDSVATLEQFQNANTALNIAKEQMKAVAFNLQFAQIRANQNGFVLRKFVNQGQQVAAGSPIVQINGTEQGSWVLKATVNDYNWDIISLGDSASLSTGSDSKEYFSGKVSRKSQSADPVTGAYWIEVSPVDLSEITFASGMFGRVTIFPRTQMTGWQIPYGALLDAQGDYGYVFVTDDQKSAKKVKVTLGKISANSVQVLSGLENHQQLIVSGSAYLTDQSPIQINPQDEIEPA